MHGNTIAVIHFLRIISYGQWHYEVTNTRAALQGSSLAGCGFADSMGVAHDQICSVAGFQCSAILSHAGIAGLVSKLQV